MKRIFLMLSALMLAVSCGNNQGSSKPVIVCTTGMIGDAVKNLVGDSIEVKVLMGPGVDPHLYKATQGDITALTKADMIVYNGLHLEGKMGEIFEKLSQRKTVVSMGSLVDKDKLINSTEYAGAEDPHIWFDVVLWAEAVEGLANELGRKYPRQQNEIEQRKESYLQELESMDSLVRTTLGKIPDSQRVMITAHDAFKYFGRAYDIKVIGLQGISTAAEYGLQDISNLVNFIVKNEIKAIFVESSVSKRAVEAVMEGVEQRGHRIELGGELYSDAMGQEGTPEGTYAGMLRHNVKVIWEALQ